MKEEQINSNDGQTNFVSLSDFRLFVRDSLEAKVRALGIAFINDLLAEEIEQLCGPAGSHKKRRGLAHRGGSELGWVVMNNQRVQIRRPRARKDGAEVPLDRYETLQSMNNVSDFVSRMMLHGISTRSYDRVIDKFETDLGLSKSAVSREFVQTSRETLNELNSRRFEGEEFWAIVMDGTEFGGSMLIVALGVDRTGKKHILGISEGSTENSELCLSLLRNLQDRGLRFSRRLLAVLDGSKALKKAVTQVFGDRVEIQRCLTHKRWNVEAKLDKQHHRELQRRMAQAYNANDFESAQSSFKQTHQWLSEINHSAAASLQEGLDHLLTLHRIGMPPALRKSFYTTNIMESAFSAAKARTRRVKRWQTQTDQVLRWAASQLLIQEERFRRIDGCKELAGFLATFAPPDENIVAKAVAG